MEFILQYWFLIWAYFARSCSYLQLKALADLFISLGSSCPCTAMQGRKIEEACKKQRCMSSTWAQCSWIPPLEVVPCLLPKAGLISSSFCCAVTRLWESHSTCTGTLCVSWERKADLLIAVVLLCSSRNWNTDINLTVACRMLRSDIHPHLC